MNRPWCRRPVVIESPPVPSSVRSEFLSRVPLLASLDADDLERLAATMHELTFEAGSVITREGERGARIAAFFVILEGAVIVEKRGSEVARLRSGDVFGEMALILDRPRTATVTAATQVRCLTTTAAEFRAFVDSHSSVAWALLETVAERLGEDD